MLDCYRRLWVEQKPLRAATDESGAPLYTTRDWAGWVLTGEPD